MEENSNPEVDSRPALLGPWVLGRLEEKYAQLMLQVA